MRDDSRECLRTAYSSHPYPVDSRPSLEIWIRVERLHDRTGVRHAGGFYDNPIEAFAERKQLPDGFYEILSHGAAEATVVHVDDLLCDLLLLLHEVAVDAWGGRRGVLYGPTPTNVKGEGK